MRASRSVLRAAVFSLLIPAVCSARAWGNEGADAFSVRAEDGLLTVEARGVPLSEVLTEIVNQMRIKIVLYGSAEQPVSATFSDLPMETGLKRLARDFNYAMISRPNGAKGGKPAIKAIHIFPKEGKGFSKEGPRVITPERPALQTFGEPHMDSLIQALEDKDAEVREEAVDGLAGLKDERTIPHLIWVLDDDRDPDVRENAAEALGEVGGPEAIDALISTLKEDDHVDVRAAAAESLGKIGGAEVIGPLTNALKDENEYVRETAVESLQEMGGDEVVPPLMDALRDPSEDVREAAAIALKRITGKDFSKELSVQ